MANVNATNTTVSGIYLNGSSNNLLYNDHATTSSGVGGGIGIIYSNNNTANRLTSEYNSYYGIRFSNSSGNQVYNSSFLGNPSDLSCSVSSAFKSLNRLGNTTCFVNSGCNFGYCSVTNNQTSTSKLSLQSNIATCGSIRNPGTY